MDERDFRREAGRIVADKLKTKRTELEKTVKKLLSDFEQETGLQVDEVDVIGRKDKGIVCVSLEVLLPHGMGPPEREEGG